MAKKNLFYNRTNNSTNIENIIDIDTLKLGRKTHKGCINYGIHTITHEVFDNAVKNNIIWPTEKPYIDKNEHKEYLGAIVIRTKSDKYVLAFLIDTVYDDCIYVEPVSDLIKDNSYTYSYYRIFPARNVKCFESKDEYESNIAKKEKKYNIDFRKFIPTFSMVTPKFKIIEIYSKTACAPNIKVGDTIHGEVPVIENVKGKDYPVSALHGCSYVNNIHIYINDTYIKSISPINFQNMFFNNFKVEQVE